jgi:hypothetical protein
LRYGHGVDDLRLPVETSVIDTVKVCEPGVRNVTAFRKTC